MATLENKYITVAYKLYTSEDGERELVEEATTEHPFQFISGLGTTIEAFESEITKLNKGDRFDFIITKDKAYGDYSEEHVVDLEKNIFEIEGRFDSEHIVAGAVVPLMDSEGHRMNGSIVEVKANTVVVDLNHPLAGADLNFIGEITENREATKEEIQKMINMISGEGCGCGCDDCNGGCEDEDGGCEDHHCN
jgi:FKBP-type peptidyl-prolyl cis-trans isomerase SlyD